MLLNGELRKLGTCLQTLGSTIVPVNYMTSDMTNYMTSDTSVPSALYFFSALFLFGKPSSLQDPVGWLYVQIFPSQSLLEK